MKEETSLSPLFTDLYELTMAAVYFEREMFAPATFSLFVRCCPENRRFFLAAGLARLQDALERFRFSEEDLAYLEGLKLFKPAFLDFLQNLRFTGEVWAIPEGTVFFPDEPLVEITAPIIEAQLVETLVINILNFETLIATKAARCVLAAAGKPVVDFSARRTQGVEASLRVARASYIAGFAATSNTLAGKLFGLPVTGTMAHSFIQSFGEEKEAFLAFAKQFPENTVLLLDTYDTLSAVPKAIEVAKFLEERGARLKGVRLDSGDLLTLSRKVRRLLDEAGLSYVKIFVSGGLDEYQIANLNAQGAPIDAFGVGTKMGVSADVPYLDTAYKLVAYDDRPVAKFSKGKTTLAGAKQLFRAYDENGLFREDWLGLRDQEPVPETKPLLQKVMASGKRTRPEEPLEKIRQRAARELDALPQRLKNINNEGEPYPVHLTPELEALQERVRQSVWGQAKSNGFRLSPPQ